MSRSATTTPPKPASVAPLNSSKVRSLLDTYLDFLAATKQKIDASNPPYNPLPKIDSQRSNKRLHTMSRTAPIFHASNPASPLAYTAKQTALFLLDYQGFCLAYFDDKGAAVVKKAKTMRDWAFKQGIMVVHSVVDVSAQPPATCKGAERIKGMLAQVAQDKEAAEEAAEIAFAKRAGEYIVLKHPGVVSGLKSKGARELLEEHGIRNLILCGISTSGAVLRTAVPATDDGFVVSVIEDACADRTAEVHEAVMKNLLPSRAHVATADEFIKAWEDGQR